MKIANIKRVASLLAKAPVIDPRDVNMLVQKMAEMVPFYTPEWHFSITDHDPGSALFMSFAEMFAGLVNRFNRVPEKNFIAFLNMLDFNLLPAQPSTAPITFTLSTGATEPVLVPAGTQVAASIPEEETPILFETVRNMLVIPSRLTGAYNINTKRDRITRVPDLVFADPREAEKTEVNLFDCYTENNLQEHIVYISHADLLNITSPSAITLEFGNTGQTYKLKQIMAAFSEPEFVHWQYWAELEETPGWYDFDECLLKENKLVLIKNRAGWLKETEVNGITGLWVRCTGLAANVETLHDVEIDSIRMSVDYYDPDTDNAGITPEMLFYNDLPLDMRDINPFGEFFVLYDSFYVASHEVFSKKGAEITLSFDCEIREMELSTGAEQDVNWKLIMKKSDFAKKEPLKKSVTKVSWEYWNGTGWLKLPTASAADEIFAGDGKKTITFTCPMDIQEAWVNNQINYWIRARIIKVENMLAASLIYCVPFISSICLHYGYDGCNCLVDRCLSLNDLEYKDWTENCKQTGAAFYPFYSQKCKLPAFYMGFDMPPAGGPISMYFSITEQAASESTPRTEWEYLRDNNGNFEWAKLKVNDNTKHMTQSGTVIFAGPPDFGRKQFFGSGPCWIRIINSDGKFDLLPETVRWPKLNHILMNTAWVIQQESTEKEILGPVEGQPNKKFTLAKSPILTEEVWVNELSDLTEDERDRLANDEIIATEIVRDNYGHILEFWVKWDFVEDFYDSGSNDRHYAVDRAMGEIRFGDGILGKIPPAFQDYGIKVNYKIGGGARGNVSPFTITNLQSPIAFINEVYNSEQAKGGCDMEIVEKAVKRGPEMIKHQNRAVTAEDFENLARQSSRSIAKVKCLPNFNNYGQKEYGWVTIVILPESAGDFARPSPELRQQVQNYIAERTSNTVAFSECLKVIEPVYMEISIFSILIAENMDIVTVIENQALEKLNSYLDPLRGGFDGTGWDIGQQPHISMFYSLLKEIPGVNFVEKVSMTVRTLTDGQAIETDPAKLAGLPHILVVNGKHKVDVLAT